MGTMELAIRNALSNLMKRLDKDWEELKGVVYNARRVTDHAYGEGSPESLRLKGLFDAFATHNGVEELEKFLLETVAKTFPQES